MPQRWPREKKKAATTEMAIEITVTMLGVKPCRPHQRAMYRE